MFINKLVDRAISLGTFREDEREVYTYAYTVFIGWIMCVFVSLVYGIAVHQFTGVLVFLFAFIPLRQLSGGFHVDSSRLCWILSVAFIVGVSIPSIMGIVPDILQFVLIGTLPSGLVIILAAPRIHPNKPIGEEDARKCKIKARLLMAAEIGISFLFFWAERNNPQATFVDFGYLAYYIAMALNLTASMILLDILLCKVKSIQSKTGRQ